MIAAAATDASQTHGGASRNQHQRTDEFLDSDDDDDDDNVATGKTDCNNL